MDQMRIGFARLLAADDAAEQVRCHAAELMLLAIEVGLIDREGIDEVLDLVVGIRPQQGEIGLERRRSGRGNALREPAIDVVPLVVGKRHAGPAIEKFAQPANILLGDVDGTRSVSFGPRHS